MKIKITITTFLLLLSSSIHAQLKFPGALPGYWTPNPNAYVDVQSPTAASLGKYGDIGVSYFTGNPNITIPLYELNVRGVRMPISLDYDASGVMPNSLPSWAGQNWTLNVGGVITRTVRGRYDEWKYPKHIESRFIYKPFNYFESHDKLTKYLAEGGNYSQLKKDLVYGVYDLSPDIFTFHFMGKSGKFFLDQDGNWRVQSNDNLEIIFDYTKPSNFIGSLFERYPDTMTDDPQQSKTIAGFVIRDDDGNEYTFGYDKGAIDYSTNFWHMSENERNETWHASSWYLTKVTDRLGNVLYKLHYTRGQYVIQVFNAYDRDTFDEKAKGILPSSFYYGISNQYFPYTVSITSPVYLSSIEAMNGLSVDIYSSNVSDDLATEKLYGKLYEGLGVQSLYTKLCSMVDGWKIPQYGNPIGGFYYLQSKKDSLPKFRYPSADDMDVLSRARIRKLNYVAIQYTKGRPCEYIGYRFCTTATANRRLRLDSLMVQNSAIHYSNTTGIKGVYRFCYDRFDKIPSDYLTTCVDHWGFYNGRPYKQSDWKYEDNLETVRNPDYAFTPIGILNAVIYPTGGMTEFEYEPNTYSKKQSNDRQSMSNSLGTGGGLRIKSIKSYDYPDKHRLLNQRDFSYNIPGSNISSGELFATPMYYWKDWNLKCEENNASYHMTTFHTSSIVPLANSTGVSLGYSYVTESIKDNSSPNKTIEKHVYHFSNLSDPSVRDQTFMLSFGFPNQFTPFDEWSERSFKKGLLLSEEVYDDTGKKIKSVGYKYRNDDYLKNYILSSNLIYECYGNSAQYYHYLGGIYKLYYPKYDIVESQDTVFDSGNSSCKIATSHKYNKSDIRFTKWLPYKHQVDMRILSSEILSRGVFSEKNSYIYGNFNANNGLDSILYKGNSFIRPLKTKYERNGQKVSEDETVYSQYGVNGKMRLLPHIITRTNSNYVKDTLINYNQYTNTGMPSNYKERGKCTTFLSWGWNDCYLMMAGNAYIPISISQTEFKDDKACLEKLSGFIKNYQAGQITGYVWSPLFGPTHIIRPNGNVMKFNYDSFGRLSNVYDYNDVLLESYQYNYRK